LIPTRNSSRGIRAFALTSVLLAVARGATADPDGWALDLNSDRAGV